MEAWLEFLSVLIWQGIVVGTVLIFRTELRALLGRLARLKIGDTEVNFQEPATDAQPLGAAPEVEIRAIGPGGFLTSEGVLQVVRDTESTADGDGPIGDPLLLFQTSQQKTWLVRTPQNLVCLLDDERTRAKGRLVQWLLPTSLASPVRARAHKATAGLLDIGPRRNWLYSTDLHPHPDRLERDITEMLERSG